MFKLKRFMDDKLEVFEFSDGHGTLARFVPARGGLLTEFFVGDSLMFYLDRDTLHDPAKNVRGGNPVLFPICGPLENGAYVLPDGREYWMNQHGLARNKAWEVAAAECRQDSALITLALTDDDETRQSYPFQFRLVFTYIIERGQITIEQIYGNCSKESMPFYAGFHPYFHAPGCKAASLRISAPAYTDIKSGQVYENTGKLDLNSKEETNLVFSDLGGQEAWFAREDGSLITVKYDPDFRYIVLWALKDRDFLCVEPWMGTNYDLNRGKAVLLGPGEEVRTTVSYKHTVIHNDFTKKIEKS